MFNNGVPVESPRMLLFQTPGRGARVLEWVGRTRPTGLGRVLPGQPG